MKRFDRNETLHQSDPTRGERNRNSMKHNWLGQGMAYASLDPEGRNSLHKGGNNDLTYASPCDRDCGCGSGSSVRRPEPIDQSVVIQGAFADSDRWLVVHDVGGWQKGTRGEVGTGAFKRRAERFGGHRSGW